MSEIDQPDKSTFKAFTDTRDRRKPDIENRVSEIVARNGGNARFSDTLHLKCGCGWELDDRAAVVLEARKLHPCTLPPVDTRRRGLKLRADQAKRARENTYRKWTRELVTAAYLSFHAKHGRPPLVREHNKLNDLPSSVTVINLFSDVKTGLASAGLQQLPRGRQPGSRSESAP